MRLIASGFTLIAIPIWFFALIAIISSQTDDVNNAAIQAYFVIAMLLAFPTALIAGFVAGPFATWLCEPRPWFSVILSLSLLGFACSLEFIARWFFSLLPQSAGWMLLPYTTFAIVGPPLFLGSTVFAILKCRNPIPVSISG
ncbi:hypothetical protein Poly51_59990 [Rubripirellula tenax]|uniref:Uncharacterized protein n=1 Tax=Rubripirellula tenax TaxID=2528015 RepID=A0A5C6E7D3_9BACT|nr:hypothetical protein Poly51_59990 [Rubripirellula tenax]